MTDINPGMSEEFDWGDFEVDTPDNLFLRVFDFQGNIPEPTQSPHSTKMSLQERAIEIGLDNLYNRYNAGDIVVSDIVWKADRQKWGFIPGVRAVYLRKEAQPKR